VTAALRLRCVGVRAQARTGDDGLLRRQDAHHLHLVAHLDDARLDAARDHRAAPLPPRSARSASRMGAALAAAGVRHDASSFCAVPPSNDGSAACLPSVLAQGTLWRSYCSPHATCLLLGSPAPAGWYHTAHAGDSPPSSQQPSFPARGQGLMAVRAPPRLRPPALPAVRAPRRVTRQL